MSTIDNKETIDKLIANDGYYPNEVNDEEPPDPRVYRIVEYENGYGKITWGVTWESESPNRRDRYLIPSQYVINPHTIWGPK